MNKRTSFRPAVLDRLEERVVLSTAHAPTIGMLGDSLTDEYRFYGRHAQNWVEQLGNAHSANFGTFQTSSRGEPRNQGFAYNWARSDATSTDMINNQLPGLVKQVAAGDVKYSVILVGDNDALHLLQSAAKTPPTPQQAQAALNEMGQTLGRNIQTAVTQLLAANAQSKVAVMTIPKLALAPITKSFIAANPSAAALIAGADQVIDAVNQQIRAFASNNPRVAVVDIDGLETTLKNSGTTTKFGNTTVTLTTASDDYHSFFLADGLHVGSIGQGQIANTVVQAINQKFGTKIKPFATSTIVNNAIHIQHETVDHHHK
jgi:lysophospholipase L1-like esterase